MSLPPPLLARQACITILCSMSYTFPEDRRVAKSVRLGPELEAKLQAIAASEGVPLSVILRRAAHRYADDRGSLRNRLADVTGAVSSRGGRARRTGRTFRRLLRRS